MDKVTGRLQVFFAEPFWVGIFERVQDGKMSVCKLTFGAEPKENEVQKFILENYYKLQYSPSVDFKTVSKERVNPKRLQREVKQQVQSAGIGTKSQQALKLQQEQGKLVRKVHSREKREAEQQRQYDMKQQKRKEKHKGR